MKNSVLAYFSTAPKSLSFPSAWVERLNRGSPHKQIERAHASTMQCGKPDAIGVNRTWRSALFELTLLTQQVFKGQNFPSTR